MRPTLEKSRPKGRVTTALSLPFPPIPALVALAGFLILSPPAQAIDANDNGLSDVWEALYPIPPGQEDEDFDLDGHTNRQESMAGLDPFSYHSRLKLQLVQHSGSSHLDIVLDTVRGHRYQVEERILPASAWDPLGPILTSATGGQMSLSIPLPSTPGVAHIYRYKVVGQVHSDPDALSDWEEFILGTNPNSADTDGDGLDDGFEFTYSGLGLDPLNPYSLDPTGRIMDGDFDADADGATNAQEAARASNPFASDLPPNGGSTLVVYTPLE